ncbi:MAG: hypothetical protein C4560_02970 [Nitrospiraceae bacterium]|nr:MAG: hypothetical protein C4560_02970 [Nitrospiraceae bacterium]
MTKFKKRVRRRIEICNRHIIDCIGKRPAGLWGISVDNDVWALRYQAWMEASMKIVRLNYAVYEFMR